MPSHVTCGHVKECETESEHLDRIAYRSEIGGPIKYFEIGKIRKVFAELKKNPYQGCADPDCVFGDALDKIEAIINKAE